jgi:hypothetical protein
MINKQKITNLAKNFFHKEKTLKSPRLMHPKREWLIGLMVAVLLFIGTAGWSAYSYIYYRDFTPDNSDLETSEVTVYRESLVEEALNQYQQREQTYNDLLDQNFQPEELTTPENSTSTDVANTATSTNSIQTEASSTNGSSEPVDIPVPVTTTPTLSN